MSTSDSKSPGLRPHERVNPFQGGRLKIIQSTRGYRFSVDALHLSGFARIGAEDRVADLGTGCGIIPLMLLLSGSASRVVGLEIQEELASQASRNARLNGFEGKMAVVRGDLRQLPFEARSFDVVLCNPPYRKVNSGRVNPDRERAVARHEILASLGDVLRAARWLLDGKGRLSTIYPAERLTDLLARMRGIGMEPKRLQAVHPSLDAPAKLVLVEGVCDGRPGLEILPPLVDQGDFSLPRP